MNSLMKMFEANETDRAPAMKATGDSLISANVKLINQLISSIDSLPEESYRQKSEAHPSSIGMHIRHVLEFYQELIRSALSAEENALCYDRRQRNIVYEESPSDAIGAFQLVQKSLCELNATDREITLLATVDPDQPLVDVRTTVRREMFHLLDHGVHHMALIRVIAQDCGHRLGRDFGMAKSTQAHNQKKG